MASTKNFLLLLCALFALVLLVSAEVSTSVDKKESSETNGVEDAKYGGYPGGGYPGGGYPGGGYPGGGYPGRGSCRYGCCRSYRYGRGCYRCCAHANEAPDAIFEDDAHN